MPNVIRKIGDEGFMNPERPETADYLASICAEIVNKYDVDGIHLDYIRYPETWKITVPRNEGRRHIDHIVRSIRDAIKPIKPWVMFSCSPIGKFDDLPRFSSRGWNAYSKVCQDAQGWLRDGLMDALFPMMYFKGDHFYPFAIDWSQHTSGRIVAGGLGTYMLHPTQQNWSLDILKREMYVLRQQQLGHAHFRSKFFTDNTKGIYQFSVNEFDRYPALIPPMTWEKSEPPAAPQQLTVDTNNGTLSWSTVDPGESYALYNVYASSQSPVDTDDPRNLIATRLMTTTLNLQRPVLNTMHYAVTAIDRYGNESEPCQDVPVSRPINALTLTTSFLQCDGQTLSLPSGYESDAYIVIETMEGTICGTHENNTQINVSSLPQGIYMVKSLNQQGITRPIGIFKK